jgi:hypothetical protein
MTKVNELGKIGRVLLSRLFSVWGTVHGVCAVAGERCLRTPQRALSVWLCQEYTGKCICTYAPRGSDPRTSASCQLAVPKTVCRANAKRTVQTCVRAYVRGQRDTRRRVVPSPDWQLRLLNRFRQLVTTNNYDSLTHCHRSTSNLLSLS